MLLKDRIKQHRLNANMTLEDVAKKIGVSKQTVQKYESGVISNIPANKIESMAKVFNCSPAELMGWDNPDMNYPEQKSERLISLYLNGILSWSKDQAFTSPETAKIKEHFAELLLRYKTAISAIANIKMNSKALRSDLESYKKDPSNSSIYEIEKKNFTNLSRREINDLRKWVSNLPSYIALVMKANTDIDYSYDESKTIEDLVENFLSLNPDGQVAAFNAIENMTYNPKYKKCDNSEELA